MALSRQWYTRGNIPFPDVSTALLMQKSNLWLIKAALKNEISTGTLGPEGAPPGSATWTCVGSSDAVAGALDGVDRWGSSFDGTKIVRAAAGVAHSWIVLQSPAGMSNGPFYVLIDWGTAVDTSVNVYIAKTAFTGGSATARPTSTGEAPVNTAQMLDASASNHNFHKVVDANGNAYLLSGVVGAGFTNLSLWFGQLTEARAGDLTNFFCAFHFFNSTPGAPSSAMTVDGRTYSNTANISGGAVRYTAEGVTVIGASEANGVDGKFDTLPAYVWATNAGGGSGIRGRWPDVATGGAMPIGGSDPSTGTQERAVFGNFLVPCSVVPAL